MSGEFAIFNCPSTTSTIGPNDPTGEWQVAFNNVSSLLYGDFVGIDHTRGTFTFDSLTGEVKGYIYDTFYGVYAPNGSSGVMYREGPFEATLLGESRYEQRITGGTEDFEGSRGQLTIVGFGGACVGHCGTYDGVWSRQ